MAGRTAAALRRAMVEQGLTYRELGAMTEMNFAYVYKLLNGQKPLPAQRAMLLAEALGVELEPEIDPAITLRLPERFMEWIAARASDQGCDAEALIVEAVAQWIKRDVGFVKCQSRYDAALARALGKELRRGAAEAERR